MFDDEEERREREALAAAGAEFLDSLNNPLKAQKYIFVCSLLTLAIFGFIFFLPKVVYNLPFETNILIASILFILGFLIGNAGWRLLMPDNQEKTSIDSGMMSGFQYTTGQDRKWTAWFVSAAIGALTIFLAVVVFELAQRNFLRL